MTDGKKPDPIEDVRQGLGLLFRAAKSVISEIPTEKLEETVVAGVKEVGRAVETVAATVEREVRQATGSAFAKKPDDPTAHAASPPAAPAEASAPSPEASASTDAAVPGGAAAPTGSDGDAGVRIATDDKSK